MQNRALGGRCQTKTIEREDPLKVVLRREDKSNHQAMTPIQPMILQRNNRAAHIRHRPERKVFRGHPKKNLQNL